HCALYQAGRCRSCQWLEKPYPQQLSDKHAQLTQLLVVAQPRQHANRRAA
ncbi:23S rRNA (uracil(747)-C(5))-methyltransferase, partial [Pantoea sp. R102]